ncbi:polysaccharide deacetylase family protein [Flammeovirgaceae bacterium SG7u.111]|nr:polysaccharide deacetylase family protein [Flammeovirgaceae bacterium SG7u.132]WPO36846.1 polysaccharide deacetylase family protein [Flammeovirgaceae bacterium SG7u.111]
MKTIIIAFVTLISLNAFSQEKKVCITVDDLPTVTYRSLDKELNVEITQKLVAIFDQYKIPAIGYVNEKKLYHGNLLDPSQVKLLELWLENGYELGNHTFSHLNYHQVPFETFTKDLLKGEKITKELAAKYDLEYKYFRHPYLRSGERKGQSDSLKHFLAEHGYTEAPVTIDNEDYLFAKAYGLAHLRGDSVQMKQIGEAYLKYMEEKLFFYEKLSNDLLGRNIQHILLVHASLLNADYLGKLAAIYQKNGYTFVSQTEVLTDPAYLSEVTRFGDWGISWIDRWALSQGKKGNFFKGDPITPGFIQELSK